ncbi:hypothetical protein DAEQUDRAFT_722741 [Daedalea quercina L-15889]|uniref:Uncharacterized protein n=1 Tax=Daedalea quercina L-15889 TaxID=1314783 RepID=A0A165SW70_9APHY|nr:hypothetical protein DAEQUDRAFT_722741 [Daedalea quercina L-15889]
MATTYVSTHVPHSPFVQPQLVHTATPTVVHTQLATPTVAPTVFTTPAVATSALPSALLPSTTMPSYYVPANGYQRARSHSMSYVPSPAPAPQPQVYYGYGQSQYPQAGPVQQPYYTTVHTSATPYHDGYSRSRRASTSYHGSPSHHRSHSSHGYSNGSSHRRSHSTSRSHSRQYSQPQVIDIRHHSSSKQNSHYAQPRRYSASSGYGFGDRLRNLFGMQPSHRYYDARTGREVTYQGRPIYHI